MTIKDENEKFGVFVGVAGATGVGKTALLNALLGYPELLPTSNHEAATAVPCAVSYSTDDTAGQRFRGRVTFRQRVDVIKQLNDFFEELRLKHDLEATTQRDEYQTQEDLEALREAQANLAPTLEMIRVL